MKETFAAHLQRTCQDDKCPWCRHNEWAVHEKLMVLTDRVSYGPELVVMVIFCTHCGYVMQFNGIVAGVIGNLVFPGLQDEKSTS